VVLLPSASSCGLVLVLSALCGLRAWPAQVICVFYCVEVAVEVPCAPFHGPDPLKRHACPEAAGLGVAMCTGGLRFGASSERKAVPCCHQPDHVLMTDDLQASIRKGHVVVSVVTPSSQLGKIIFIVVCTLACSGNAGASVDTVSSYCLQKNGQCIPILGLVRRHNEHKIKHKRLKTYYKQANPATQINTRRPRTAKSTHQNKPPKPRKPPDPT